MAHFSVIGWIILFIGFLIFLCCIVPSKGKAGEKTVSRKLGRLPKDEYMVLNDVMLPTAGGSTQIDHLVISLYGIFVIETKNYSGWIYGGEYSEYWTQNIYGNKYRLYNPILQNAGHIRVLKRLLSEFGPLPFLSIVAFSGGADLKIKTDEACVIYWSRIRKVISRYDERKLTWNQVESISKKIQSVQLRPTKEAMRRHRRNVRNIRKHKDAAVKSGRCPRCGAALVIRTGKHGNFRGCVNFPRCRYTHPC